MSETEQQLRATIAQLRQDIAAYDATLQVRHTDALEALRALSGLPPNYRPILYWVPDDPAYYELVRKRDA